MNQCSTVLFDHAAPADDRPLLLDGFASTIAQLVRTMFRLDLYLLTILWSELGTIVVKQYWRNLERLRLCQSRLTDFEKIDQASGIYLEITTEGILLRELRDIMNELHIIMEIYFQQLRVAKDFSKSLHMLCREESFSDPGDILQELRRILGSLNDRQAGAPTNGDIHAITSLDTQGILRQERSIPNSTLKKS
jgi:hypothetical protein